MTDEGRIFPGGSKQLSNMGVYWQTNTVKGKTNGRQDRKRETHHQHRTAGTHTECIGKNAGRRDHAWQYGNLVCD
jgi:hypothetical protein